MRVVLVAEGCIHGNASELVRVLDRAEALAAGGYRVVVAYTVVPDMGCGRLYAVVGPRGGVHDVVFASAGDAMRVGRAELAYFEPTRIHDRSLWERILRKHKLTEG